MVSKKTVQVRNRLTLVEGTRANILVESTETTSNVRNTSKMLAVGPNTLRSSSNSIANLLQSSGGRVTNTTNVASRATTAVDSKSTLNEVSSLFTLAGCNRLLGADLLTTLSLGDNIVRAAGVGDHVGSEHSVVHVVAGISGHRSAGAAAVVEELLDVVDGLADGPAATVGLLVEDAEGRVADGDGGLDAGNVLAILELLVLVHAAELGLGFTEETLVAGAEARAAAVDAKGSSAGNSSCSEGEKRASKHFVRCIRKDGGR